MSSGADDSACLLIPGRPTVTRSVIQHSLPRETTTIARTTAYSNPILRYVCVCVCVWHHVRIPPWHTMSQHFMSFYDWYYNWCNNGIDLLHFYMYANVANLYANHNALNQYLGYWWNRLRWMRCALALTSYHRHVQPHHVKHQLRVQLFRVIQARTPISSLCQLKFRLDRPTSVSHWCAARHGSVLLVGRIRR